MKKILFLLPSLGGGGAERVVTYLANGFSQLDGLEVTLLLLNKNNNDYISLLDKKVKVEYLVLNSRLRFCIPTVLKAIVSRKPNIVFIGYDTLNYALSPFIIALKIRGIKIVVRETNILSKRFKPNFLNRIKNKTNNLYVQLSKSTIYGNRRKRIRVSSLSSAVFGR